MASKNLVNRHDPKTTSNKLQLKLEFNSSKLGDSKKDPEVWIANLEVIWTKLRYMDYAISDEDMMIQIINNLTKEYEVFTDQLET